MSAFVTLETNVRIGCSFCPEQINLAIGGLAGCGAIIRSEGYGIPIEVVQTVTLYDEDVFSAQDSTTDGSAPTSKLENSCAKGKCKVKNPITEVAGRIEQYAQEYELESHRIVS